jgi:serine protease AprX
LTLVLEGAGLYVLPAAAPSGAIAGFVKVRRANGHPGRGLVATKLLVTLRDQNEARTVRDSGMEVLAEYPDSMLVRGTDEQAQRLVEQGLEADTLPEQPVRVTGTSFAFEDAVRAQETVTLEPPAGRTAYYLVRLIGPAAPEWLQALRVRGVQVHSSLASSGSSSPS